MPESRTMLGLYSSLRQRECSSAYHRGIENTSSINVKLQAVVHGNLANLVCVFYGQTFPTTTAEEVRNIQIITLSKKKESMIYMNLTSKVSSSS
jgi:hypothetical protein